MQSPLHVLSARLQSDTPVCGVALEPYILVRRADGTTVSAGEDIAGQPVRATRRPAGAGAASVSPSSSHWEFSDRGTAAGRPACPSGAPNDLG
jgi:hypothetical protein